MSNLHLLFIYIIPPQENFSNAPTRIHLVFPSEKENTEGDKR